jgi:hypothetical protein
MSLFLREHRIATPGDLSRFDAGLTGVGRASNDAGAGGSTDPMRRPEAERLRALLDEGKKAD